MGAVHHTIAPSMYPKLDYNLETDFVPVGADLQRAAGDRRQPAARAGDDLKELLEHAAQEPGQAQLRLGRQRHLAPPGRRAVQAADQDLHHPHPVPRRRPGAAGPDRRPGRHDVRRPRLVGQRTSRAAASRRWRSRRASARRAFPTCRPAPRPACRPTRSPPGTACGRRRARRARSSQQHAGRDAEGVRDDRDARHVDRPRRRDAEPVRRRVRRFVSAEIKRWAEVVKASGAKLD